MKRLVLLLSFFISVSMFAQNTIDWETVGQNFLWRAFSNVPDTVGYSLSSNPDNTGINPSSQCGKFVIETGAAPWAGIYTDSYGNFTLTAENCKPTIMVYKDVISNFNLKLEFVEPGTHDNNVPNTVTNQWENLTFDYTADIGKTVRRITIIPDFSDPRTAGSTNYFDNVVFIPGTKDPASLPVYQTSSPITIDGVLSEDDWAVEKPRLMFRLNGEPFGNNYTPTIDTGLVVKQPYTDTSTCFVRFLHNGMDVYVSLWSNDKSVCKFDWEGDGMFMKVKDATGTDREFKLYVINDTTFGAEPGGGMPAGAISGIGVVNGTIFDSTDVDSGYVAEGVIHLDSLGFATLPASITVMINIFDPDQYHLGSPGGSGGYGNYAKQWWGSEWGGGDNSFYRTLNLLTEPVPVELTSFTAIAQNGQVLLNWSTSTETNNRAFEIERKASGNQFATIGFVNGHGTTTETQQYSFIDKNIFPGSYIYRLKQIDFDGTYEYSNAVEINVLSNLTFALDQNYPNPFNPTTTIRYTIPEKSLVTIKVFDVLGNQVSLLLNDEIEAGVHQVNFNASNLSSGVYYYSISAGNFTNTKKLMLVK